MTAPEAEMAGPGPGAPASGEAGTGDDAAAPAVPGEFSISDDNEDGFVGSPSRSGPPAEDAPEAESSFAPPAAQLGAIHGLLLVAAASFFLFVLFFFDLDRMIRILYGLGGSVVMNHIIFHPLYAKVFMEKKLAGAAMSKKLNQTAFANLPGCSGVTFTWIEVASSISGWVLGLAWIVIGLTRVQPMTSTFYWVIQDVMGVCFCVLILGLIHINTIMVASILLCLVFVYDVFYVLISPYIFGRSVMTEVAMGSTSQASLSYCLKYPLEKACKGRFAPLPQLLAFPWINDFRGGFSIVGLGDIVLPGLLVSFAARYDAAKALVRKCSRASSNDTGDAESEPEYSSGESSTWRYRYLLGRVTKAVFRSYFGPLSIAYGVGLMIAYVVVWTTKSSQPALLYLVPVTLGTVFFLGWRRRELSELWSGPKIIKKANRMVAMAQNIPEAAPAALPEREMV